MKGLFIEATDRRCGNGNAHDRLMPRGSKEPNETLNVHFSQRHSLRRHRHAVARADDNYQSRPYELWLRLPFARPAGSHRTSSAA